MIIGEADASNSRHHRCLMLRPVAHQDVWAHCRRRFSLQKVFSCVSLAVCPDQRSPVSLKSPTSVQNVAKAQQHFNIQSAVCIMTKTVGMYLTSDRSV